MAGVNAEAKDIRLYHPMLGLVGRIMFTLIFFLSGITHFTSLDDYVKLMPTAIPFREFWVMISALVELLGGALVVTNIYPRLGGWLLFVFLIPVTITVHGVGMFTVPDQQMAGIQTSFFLKGVTMAGAALLITQLGVTKSSPS